MLKPRFSVRKVTICVFDKGTKKIREFYKKELNKDIAIITPTILTKRDQAFTLGNIFDDEEDIEKAKEIFAKHGSRSMPFGFENCALLFSFFYGCPNNTLSAFWVEHKDKKKRITLLPRGSKYPADYYKE